MQDKVVSVEQMRQSDAYTIEHYVPSKELMYRAAYGVYKSYDEWTDKRIGILVDCILGTGFKGEVRSMARDAIDAINSSDAYVNLNLGLNICLTPSYEC